MDNDININKPDILWHYNDDMEYGQWYFECQPDIDYSKFYDYYIDRYFQLTKKYGILVPYKNSDNEILRSIQDNENKNIFGITSIYYYNVDKNRYAIFPSWLFIKENDHINLKFVYDIANLNNLPKSNLQSPVKLQGTSQSTKTKLPYTSIVLNTNVFFKTFFYSKHLYTKNNNLDYSGFIGKEIDNSDMVYLNTTRFNSFLRDLKRLNKICGSIFKYECFPDDYTTENGILVNNEIIFYEDVYDILPEEHKYKPFEEIQIELDNTNYKKWLEKNKNN